MWIFLNEAFFLAKLQNDLSEKKIKNTSDVTYFELYKKKHKSTGKTNYLLSEKQIELILSVDKFNVDSSRFKDCFIILQTFFKYKEKCSDRHIKIIESFLGRHGLVVKKNELFFWVCRFKNIELVMSLDNGEIRVTPKGFTNFPANMKFFDYDWDSIDQFNSALDMNMSEETPLNVHSSSLKIPNHQNISETIREHSSITSARLGGGLSQNADTDDALEGGLSQNADMLTLGRESLE